MKKITIPCDFNGQKISFPIYIGNPDPDSHPLQYQSRWLSENRGGSIPQEVMDSFEKLHTIAKERNVSFEDLAVYALGSAQEENSSENQQ
ncbi:DUF2610 domain-containing protein [Nostoc sp. CHAB 5834]|nr:DUF2610 domain-containing protein [Nostoc sp. CHAB 5834]